MVGREQRAQAKQAQILSAAAALFQERGFDGTSTDAVAALARVSKETLYRYYPSKERLLVAVMREIAIEGLFTGAPPQLPQRANRELLEQTLCSLATAVLDRILTREYIALARLILAESGRRPELAETFRRLVPEAGAEGVMRILADAQRQGLIRREVDLAAARQLFVGPLLRWALLGVLVAGREDPPRPTPAEIRTIVQLFLDGVGVQP
ncbi:MAG TPA: TetR/AcrR family transcriptional regulator [Roseiflexaceae bacterium]|jgi:AcrR family transcriptional regulator